MINHRLLSVKIPLWTVIFMIFIGLIGPYILPYSPNDFSFDALQSPSKTHLLGTNTLGQDLFSGWLMGFRISIGVAMLSATISTLIGTVLAFLCAYYRGWIEEVIVKTTDLFMIMPEIILIMVFATFMGPGTLNVILVISLVSWSRVTRVIRGKAVMAIKDEKVLYTLLLKANPFFVFKKLWLEIYPSVATMFILQCSKAVMYETNLSFLGIGDPTVKSWGRMIRQGLDFEGVFQGYYLWWLLPPIVAIVVFIWCLSLISLRVEK